MSCGLGHVIRSHIGRAGFPDERINLFQPTDSTLEIFSDRVAMRVACESMAMAVLAAIAAAGSTGAVVERGACLECACQLLALVKNQTSRDSHCCICCGNVLVVDSLIGQRCKQR